MRFPGGQSDDSAIDETHGRFRHRVTNLDGTLRRDGIRIDEQSMKARLQNVACKRFCCMRRTDADDYRALSAQVRERLCFMKSDLFGAFASGCAAAFGRPIDVATAVFGGCCDENTHLAGMQDSDSLIWHTVTVLLPLAEFRLLNISSSSRRQLRATVCY